MEDRLNIVCIADDKYAQHCAVMLCSLFETNRDKQFNVYLITNDFSDVSAERLTELCSRYGSGLFVKRCSDDKFSDLSVGQWNTVMYFKLLMPQLLPEKASRCLFLDVDMIINDDISALYNIPMDDCILAAVEDLPESSLHKDRLGMSQEGLYFNSGVMVCDLVKWREKGKKNHIIEFTRSVADKILNDQDVIALYFKSEIKCLPIRWNMVTFYFERKPRIQDKYLPDLKAAKQSPGIIHFACPIKPWYRDCNHPYGKLYRQYLEKLPWITAIPRFPIYEQLSPRQRFNKHIKNFLNRIGILKQDGYLVE